MNLKKMFLACLLICGLVAGWSLSAIALDYYPICTVNGIGPYGGGTNSSARIFLTDLTNPPAWQGSREFRIPLNRMNQFMAVAMTAIVSGNKV